ncbi:MAG: hypothetical protein K2O89_02735 [Clostridia bacterium]|nr:hypothetical protein [Clostridia bacterium]
MIVMEEIVEAFDSAETVSVYNDGDKTVYSSGEEEYAKILACWNEMIDGAHDMPAFGVSLDNYTRQEMKQGLWVEFDFGKVLECNGMPFEKLLISVKKSFQGFNLIRYNADCGYDGRCFYLDLVGKNMDNLYNLLLNL